MEGLWIAFKMVLEGGALMIGIVLPYIALIIAHMVITVTYLMEKSFREIYRRDIEAEIEEENEKRIRNIYAHDSVKKTYHDFLIEHSPLDKLIYQFTKGKNRREKMINGSKYLITKFFGSFFYAFNKIDVYGVRKLDLWFLTNILIIEVSRLFLIRLPNTSLFFVDDLIFNYSLASVFTAILIVKLDSERKELFNQYKIAVSISIYIYAIMVGYMWHKSFIYENVDQIPMIKNMLHIVPIGYFIGFAVYGINVLMASTKEKPDKHIDVMTNNYSLGRRENE